MKTYSKKASEVSRIWVEIDAASAPLGRVASAVASRLIGKYKATYTPNIDDGDYVVVINADKAVVTGDKETAKVYYRHTEFPGGIKARTLAEAREKDPTQIIIAAVKGMLPRNKLAAERLKRLRVFAGEAHTHAPQKPVKVKVKK